MTLYLASTHFRDISMSIFYLENCGQGRGEQYLQCCHSIAYTNHYKSDSANFYASFHHFEDSNVSKV